MCIPAGNGLKALSTFRPECSGLLQGEDVLDLTWDVTSKDTCSCYSQSTIVWVIYYARPTKSHDANHVCTYVRVVCSRVHAESSVNSLWNLWRCSYLVLQVREHRLFQFHQKLHAEIY